MKTVPEYLYHYSKVPDNKPVPFDKLRSLNKQTGNQVSACTLLPPMAVGYDVGKWDYKDHISLFMEPIPLNIVAGAFKEHAFWYPGNALYEYTIKLSALDKFNYYLAESHEKTDLINEYFFIKKLLNGDETDDPRILKEYGNKKIKIHKDMKYIGQGISDLKIAIANSNADIVQDYLKLPKQPLYLENITKYAATIPHLMVYPFNGEIEIFSSRTVIVGNARKFC